jgi:hypothetical protein
MRAVLARAVGALMLAGVCAALVSAWLAPGNVMALSALSSLCH